MCMLASPRLTRQHPLCLYLFGSMKMSRMLSVLPGTSFPAVPEERRLWTLVPVASRVRHRGNFRRHSAGGRSHAVGAGGLGGYQPLGGVRRMERPGKSPLLLMHCCNNNNSKKSKAGVMILLHAKHQHTMLCNKHNNTYKYAQKTATVEAEGSLPSLSFKEQGLISPSGFFDGVFLNWTAVENSKRQQMSQLFIVNSSSSKARCLFTPIHEVYLLYVQHSFRQTSCDPFLLQE